MDTKTKDILQRAGISAELTDHILQATDQGRLNPPAIAVQALPPVDGRSILDFARADTAVFRLEAGLALERLCALGATRSQAQALLDASGLKATAGMIEPTRRQLRGLGLYLLPLVSYGVLNGGSASSYYDQKKNQEFSPGLFAQLHELIGQRAQRHAGQPKGIGPAFLEQADPSAPTPSFMELKLRAWLLLLRESQRAMAALPGGLPWQGLEKALPVFQMSNRASAAEIDEALNTYRESPFLKDLIAETGIEACTVQTGIQDLVAAFTPPLPDGTRQVFLEAYGQPGAPLGLPGGHGQNFKVLDGVYRALFGAGKRLAYLGNIDNLGFVPDPAAVAAQLLLDAPASFEFSFKTRMDRKGGVLVSTPQGTLTCGDIGQAVSTELIAATEASGKPILFNCATGLFKLDWLVPRLEEIQTRLPIRFSNQNKDAGKYSQGEQTTWEVIGLIDKPLILAVDKQERFLAAKFFLDCLLTSGLGKDSPALSAEDQEILATGRELHRGMLRLLDESYGLVQKDGHWLPKP